MCGGKTIAFDTVIVGIGEFFAKRNGLPVGLEPKFHFFQFRQLMPGEPIPAGHIFVPGCVEDIMLAHFLGQCVGFTFDDGPWLPGGKPARFD